MLRALASPSPSLRLAKQRAFSVSSTRPASRLLKVMAQKNSGHQAPASTSAPDEAIVRLREHQSNAVRQTFPDECRTLLHVGRYAVLSTISKEYGGAPGGAVVGFASDPRGRPIFFFSTMSGHTRDVMEDPRCSLTVTAPDFQGAADARVTLTGALASVPEGEREAATAQYLEKHPDAFWVAFGDFSCWRMDEISGIRLVGGFARAGTVPLPAYDKAAPDPVAGEAQELIARWTAAAPGAPLAWVRHYVGDVGVDAAAIASLDRLGLNLKARRGKDNYKMRLPFPQPADTVAQVEEQMRAMDAASAAVRA